MDLANRVLLLPLSIPLFVGMSCGLSGCTGHEAVGAGGVVVQAGRSRCGEGWKPAAAGNQTLAVHNADASAVDVALVDPSEGAIFAELDGVGPGTTRPMRVSLAAGAYAVRCRPEGGAAVTGPVVRVTGPGAGARGVRPLTRNDLYPAVRAYRASTARGLGVLERRTDVLLDAVRGDDLKAAQEAWLPAHLAYERLGAAYGTFGHFADEIDRRPARKPKGVHDRELRQLRGFRRVEWGLWHRESAASLRGPAARLARSVRALRDDFPRQETEPGDLGLRAHEILEDTLQFELTGKTDQGSGTTLATVAANVEGTRAVLAALRPALEGRMPELSEIDRWLQRTSRALATHRRHGRWTPLDRLSAVERERIDGDVGELVERLAEVAAVGAVRRTS